MQNSECQILRREFLGKTAMGIGAIAAASLLDRELTTHAAGPTAGHGLTGLHHPGKAKRVIYLFQSGGPSQLDLFDYKPLLNEQHGQHVPKSILGKQRVTLMTRHQKNFTCFGSPYQFSRHGDSGQWLSSAIPHMAKMADDWCFVKTVHSEPINHDPAMTFMQTGQQIPGRPALGSWLHYGLGSECEELPAYLVMTSGVTQQPLLSRYWHSGMLPARYQGVQLRSTGDPVLFLSNPTGMDHAGRGRIVEAINRLNRLQVERVGDPEIEARINAFEMAYKMQTVVPQIINFADEPQHILDMYGPDVVRPGTYAHQCLMARRLSERGVRFIQIFHAGWDQHRDLVNELNRQTQATDQATTALIQDLKQRRAVGRKRSWSGVASSVALRLRRMPGATSQQDVTIIPAASRWRWRAGVFEVAPRLGRPTTMATTLPRTWSTFATCTPRCSIVWVSITTGLPIDFRASTPGLLGSNRHALWKRSSTKRLPGQQGPQDALVRKAPHWPETLSTIARFQRNSFQCK